MYGFDETTNSEGSGFTGIQHNFELAGVRYGKVSTKEESTAVGLIFDFKRGENFNFPIVVYPVNESMVVQYKRKIKDKNTQVEREETNQEAIQRAYNEQGAFVKHIISKFVPEDKAKIAKVPNFEAFAKAVISLLGDSFKETKVRLKILYNKKGYLTVPQYPPFIERMDVNPTQLKITDYDKKWLDKPTADKDNKNTGSTSGSTPGMSPAGGEDF
jgi:hypothetical protein